MKIVASVCAGIALVGSIVAVNSWLELRKQREVNAAWREQQVDVPLPTSLPAAPPPDTTVAAATARDTPISGTESSISSPAKNNDAYELGKSLVNPERQREQMKDPNFRKTAREQYIARLRRDDADLARELGLSQDEVERLFDLLADDNLARLDVRFLGEPNVDATEARLDLDRQLEESIRAQLGDKYPRWQAYQPTRPTRAQVASLSTQLTRAGMPLAGEQYKSLTTAWIADRQRQAEEKKILPQSPPLTPADLGYRAQKIESVRRMLGVAAPYVDAAQLAAMRKMMEPETDRERAIRNAAQRQQGPAQ